MITPCIVGLTGILKGVTSSIVGPDWDTEEDNNIQSGLSEILKKITPSIVGPDWDAEEDNTIHSRA